MKKAVVATTLLGSVAAAALLGTRFNPRPGTKTGRWYANLEKSPLNPPDKVFGPVWTTLYTAMAIAAFRIWNAPDSEERTDALRLWFGQLALNAAWSPIFFGAKHPRAALADLGGLAVTQAAFVRKAARVDSVAASLFIPYMAWVAFAGYLNVEIVRRNRGRF